MNEPEKNENSQNSDQQKSWIEKVKAKVEFQFTTKNPLKILVFFLQGVSFTTTLEGSKIVLGDNSSALLFAIAIQVTLLILVLFQAAKESPIRKWFSVIVITVISIYASFFSFYNQLTKNKQEINKETATATQVHDNFVRKVCTPISDDFKKLEDQNKNYGDRIKKEKDGEGETGVKGIGDKVRSLMKKQESIQDEIRNLKQAAIAAQELLKFSVTEKTANQIFIADSDAANKIGAKFLEKYKAPKLARKNYIESDQITFVTPYNKIIKEPNQNAIVSLFMALTIDGLALILGSAIDPHPSNLFMVFTDFCVHIILGFKRSILTLFSTIRKEAEPYQTHEADGLKDSIIVIILLDHKGSEFLLKFYESIDFQTHIIDINSLIKNEESSSFKIGYRLLLDTMKCRPLRWIEIDSKKGQGGDSKEKQWRVSDTHYPSMKRWLARQISEQLNKEELVTSGEFLLKLEFPL
jgi:hypothetical protein